jgi:DNA-binding transcriptional regulator GbsR (MarR family)
MTEKNNKVWKQPWVIYIIITSIIGLTSFLVTTSFKTDANTKNIEEVKKCLDERPTNKELKPEFENIKKDINEIKETQKEIYRLLLKAYIKPNS